MSTYTSVQEWTKPLRSFPLGVSMTSFFLVPSDYATLPTGKQPVQRLPLSTLQASDKVESENLARLLREMTGLPVERLASLAKVSRNAYNKWLDGRGISDE